jgi:uncharacterized membrane protein
MAGAGPGGISRSFVWASALLGFAQGGFADGILFHQVLQWHHLLSGMPGSAFRDLRVQMLADGVFHVAMYALMALGLLLLWRARGSFTADAADRFFAAFLLIGFGFWHVVDGIFAHWLLGIHHIRMASDNVLLWDLVVFVFGLAAVAMGVWIGRRQPRVTHRVRTPGMPSAILVGIVIGAGLIATQPPQHGATALLFRSGTDARTALAAITATDARLVWSDPAEPTLWVVDVDEAQLPQLYARGVILTSRSILPAGCFTALASR